MRIFRLWLLVFVSVCISACSTIADKAQVDMSAASHEAAKIFKNGKYQDKSGAMTVSKVPWIGNKVVPLAEKEPAVFLKTVGNVDSTPVTLPVIAQRITEVTNVPVTLAQDLYEVNNNSKNGASVQQTSVLGSTASANAGINKNALENQRAIADIPISVPFKGTLKQFLDIISARLNITWTYAHNSILLHRYMTKVFYVHALPGGGTVAIGNQSSNGANTSSGNSGGNFSGASAGVVSSGSASLSKSASAGMSVNMAATVNPWDSVINGIRAMLSANGRVSVSGFTGSVVVTDTPDVVREVGDYIARENNLMTRQVAFQVRLLTVSTTNTENRGLNLSAAFNDSHLSFTSITQGLSFSAANNFAVGIIDTKSNWNGTTSVIQAISKVAKIQQNTVTTGITLNNEPIPLRVTQTNGYLAQISVSTVQGGASQQSLEPGSITTGFQMSLLPRIMENDQMLLQYAISLSTNLGFTTDSSGGQTIRTPNTTDREFVNRFMVRSGQVVVVTGFNQSTDNVSSQGTAAPDNWILGGGRSAEKSHTQLVMLITPVLLDIRSHDAGN